MHIKIQSCLQIEKILIFHFCLGKYFITKYNWYVISFSPYSHLLRSRCYYPRNNKEMKTQGKHLANDMTELAFKLMSVLFESLLYPLRCSGAWKAWAYRSYPAHLLFCTPKNQFQMPGNHFFKSGAKEGSY